MDLSGPTGAKVLGSLGMVVIAALGWTFVVGPETSSLSETRDQVEAARQQNVVLLQQLADLEEQQQQVRKTRRVAEQLAAKFPPTADQPGLFEQVTAAAVDAGIGPQGVTTLAPSPPVIGGTEDGVTAEEPAVGAGSLASQDVSVSVTGTYDQTQRLLENLEQMSRAYLITSVSLSGGGEEGADSYTTTVSGQMFVMPPIADPDEAEATTAQSTAQSTGQD